MSKTVEETEQPQVADIAIYTRPWQDDEFHVMLVTDHGVLGSCPERRCVAEEDARDYAPGGWRLTGFRRLPIEKLRER